MSRPKKSADKKAERRKWLAERPRKIASEEEAAGFEEIAAEFRQRADDIEAGKMPKADDQ